MPGADAAEAGTGAARSSPGSASRQCQEEPAAGQAAALIAVVAAC